MTISEKIVILAQHDATVTAENVTLKAQIETLNTQLTDANNRAVTTDAETAVNGRVDDNGNDPPAAPAPAQ